MGSVSGGFDSWNHMIRFVITLLAIFIMTSLFFNQAKSLIISKDSIEIIMNDGEAKKIEIGGIRLLETGLQIESSDGLSSYSQVSIPADQPWVKTGIMVNSGDHVKIQASGSAVLAAHLLIEDYSEPENRGNSIGWFRSSPGGRNLINPFLTKREADEVRADMMPLPSAKVGQLIGVIVPQSIANSDQEKPSILNFQPKDAFFIGKSKTKKYSDPNGEPGVVFLTVNDLVFNFSDDNNRELWHLNHDRDIIKQSYYPFLKNDSNITKQKIDEKIADLTLLWQRAKRENTPETLYKDNLGFYSVTVVTQGKKKN